MQIQKLEDHIRITLPAGIYDFKKLHHSFKKLNFQFNYFLDINSSQIIFDFGKNAKWDIISDYFSLVNVYPTFNSVNINSFRNSINPILSCIILMTANDLFVKRNLIKSIIHNSRNSEIEIIIVYNGLYAELNDFKNCKLIKSNFGWVSKGYNAGVSHSKGEYIALFHDDCIVNDSDWIDKCIKSINSEMIAVSPEIVYKDEFKIAKNVPLVIRKSDFENLGGYDELFHVGFEDMDFTYKILESNKKISRIKMNYLHFNGMSTIIMYSGERKLFRELFGLNILPKNYIAKLNSYYISELLKNNWARLIQYRDLHYFIKKHKNYFERTGQQVGLNKKSILEKYLSKFDKHPFINNNENFRKFYREQFSIR